MNRVIHQTEGERVAWLVESRNKLFARARVDSKVRLIFRKEWLTFCRTKIFRCGINSSRHLPWRPLYIKFLNYKRVRLVIHRVRTFLGGQLLKHQAASGMTNCPSQLSTFLRHSPVTQTLSEKKTNCHDGFSYFAIEFHSGAERTN